MNKWLAVAHACRSFHGHGRRLVVPRNEAVGLPATRMGTKGRRLALRRVEVHGSEVRFLPCMSKLTVKALKRGKEEGKQKGQIDSLGTWLNSK